MPDLSLFYRVAAEENRLQQLADALLAHDLVDAAYVEPPAEPPTVLDQSPRVGLNDMAPDAGDAPPSTRTFVDHQIYRNQTPTGVDALFAGTLPGGDGSGVHIIDCDWAWRFTHEGLLQKPGRAPRTRRRADYPGVLGRRRRQVRLPPPARHRSRPRGPPTHHQQEHSPRYRPAARHPRHRKPARHHRPALRVDRPGRAQQPQPTAEAVPAHGPTHAKIDLSEARAVK